MNKIERAVYDIVKSNPKIKLFIRNVYQAVFDILPRRKEFSINPIDFKEDYFFGFHDIQPFCEDNRKVLANKLSFDLKMPAKDDFIEVGYFDFVDGRLKNFNKVGESNSWNYHKGCRLQWLGKNRLIFNCTYAGEMVSKIVNIESKEETILPVPIDSVSRNGRLATSFSYERLEKYMPGYGYNHEDKISFVSDPHPINTGLFLIDLETKERRLLVDLRSLAQQSLKEENSRTSYHYVTHSLFSNDGRYISFFHRWVGEETFKRYTRLMIYDLELDKLFQVPTGYMVSHYVWNDNHEIIAYCNYQNTDAHTLLKIRDLGASHHVVYPQLNSDGHQSFIDSNTFITDTYGDKWRMSKLYKVGIATDKAKLIASVYSPKKFQTKHAHKHIACDLHPRVSNDGQFVCFDTAKSGRRSLAVMSLRDRL